MAALVRYGTLRACRNIALIATRNKLGCLRYAQKTTILNVNHIISSHVSCTRFLSDSFVTQNEAGSEETSTQNQETQEINDSRLPFDKRPPPQQRLMSHSQYNRMIQKLGTISARGSLMQLFETILEKEEGKVTQLQAYQLLRNCGKELMYESPQKRIELAHVIWDKLLASGVQVDIMMYNALLSVYIQNSYEFNPLEVLEQIQAASIEPNLITMALIIKGFAQKGDIAGVFKVLEFMKTADMPVTEPVYSALITAYWKTGDIESAKGVFNIMSENGLDPGLESYTTLLSAYAEDGNLEAIDETISEMQEKKIYPNHSVYLSLIDVFAKAGQHQIIPRILEKPAVRRLVEFDILSVMIALVSRGDVDAGIVLLDFVPTNSYQSSVTPQFLLLKQVINTKQPLNQILKVIDILDRQGTMKNVFETALDLSFGIREPEKSISIIKEMLDKKILVKNHYFYPVMAAYADKLNAKGTQETYTLMAENGLDLDPISLGYMVKSFGQPKDADVTAFMNLSKDIPLSPYLVKTIAQLIMESGFLDKLDKILDYAETEIKEERLMEQTFQVAMKRSFDPNNAVNILHKLNGRGLTSNLPAFISDLLETKCRNEIGAKMGAEFITLMLQQGLGDLLDSRSYTSVMKHLNINHLHKEFYEFMTIMKDNHVPLDEHHYRQMIRMFSYIGKSRATQFCFQNFQKLTEPDESIYSLLISAYGHSEDGGFLSDRVKLQNPKRIIQIYEEMKELDLLPQSRAKPYVIMSYLALGRIDEAVQIKEEFGDFSTLSYRVETSFMKAFADKGDTESTLKVLERIKAADNMHVSTYSYTTAIGAFKFSGDIESQRRLLEEMKEQNIKRNSFTYDEMMNTFLLKDDLEGALQILEKAKEDKCYPTTMACLSLANVCGKVAPDRLESVVNEVMEHKLKGRAENSLVFSMHGLIFVCVSHGRNDLAENLIERLPHHSTDEYGKVSSTFSRKGDVDGILKCKAFLEQNDMSSSSLLIPLIRAYDVVGDPTGALEAYNAFIASNGRPWTGLQVILGNILRKHNQPLPFDYPERKRRRFNNEDRAEAEELSEESEAEDTEMFQKD